MSQTNSPAGPPPAGSPDPPSPGPIEYIKFRAGHPRFNAVVVLLIIVVVLALSLIEAHRLAVGG